MLRQLRALITALRMAAQGRTPDTPAFRLAHWCAQTTRLIDAIYAAANAAGLPESARRALTFTIEGRRTNMQTILATVRFHADQEYPTLLREPTEQALAALQATNFNDLFLIQRLSENMPQSGLGEILTGLQNHLREIPEISASKSPVT